MSLGEWHKVPVAQRSPGSAADHVSSGSLLFLLTGLCGLPEALLDQIRPLFLKGNCAISENYTKVCTVLVPFSEAPRAQPILLQPSQPSKIMQEWGMISRVIVGWHVIFDTCHRRFTLFSRHLWILRTFSPFVWGKQLDFPSSLFLCLNFMLPLHVDSHFKKHANIYRRVSRRFTKETLCKSPGMKHPHPATYIFDYFIFFLENTFFLIYNLVFST